MRTGMSVDLAVADDRAPRSACCGSISAGGWTARIVRRATSTPSSMVISNGTASSHGLQDRVDARSRRRFRDQSTVPVPIGYSSTILPTVAANATHTRRALGGGSPPSSARATACSSSSRRCGCPPARRSPGSSAAQPAVKAADGGAAGRRRAGPPDRPGAPLAARRAVVLGGRGLPAGDAVVGAVVRAAAWRRSCSPICASWPR